MIHPSISENFFFRPETISDFLVRKSLRGRNIDPQLQGTWDTSIAAIKKSFFGRFLPDEIVKPDLFILDHATYREMLTLLGDQPELTDYIFGGNYLPELNAIVLSSDLFLRSATYQHVMTHEAIHHLFTSDFKFELPEFIREGLTEVLTRYTENELARSFINRDINNSEYYENSRLFVYQLLGYLRDYTVISPMNFIAAIIYEPEKDPFAIYTILSDILGEENTALMYSEYFDTSPYEMEPFVIYLTEILRRGPNKPDEQAYKLQDLRDKSPNPKTNDGIERRSWDWHIAEIEKLPNNST